VWTGCGVLVKLKQSLHVVATGLIRAKYGERETCRREREIGVFQDVSTFAFAA
jgi:hypothetical protein